MTSLDRFNQAWDDSTIRVIYNQESNIYFVSLEGFNVRRAQRCGIPQVFPASSYDAMLATASSHGYCFESVGV